MQRDETYIIRSTDDIQKELLDRNTNIYMFQ